MTGSTDYDATRLDPAHEPDEESLRLLGALGRGGRSGRAGTVDGDENDPDEALGLLVADLANFFAEKAPVPVVPVQVDEFVCHRCFLIFHRSRIAGTRYEQPICRDCA
jgi:hypothetical protein